MRVVCDDCGGLCAAGGPDLNGRDDGSPFERERLKDPIEPGLHRHCGEAAGVGCRVVHGPLGVHVAEHAEDHSAEAGALRFGQTEVLIAVYGQNNRVVRVEGRAGRVNLDLLPGEEVGLREACVDDADELTEGVGAVVIRIVGVEVIVGAGDLGGNGCRFVDSVDVQVAFDVIRVGAPPDEDLRVGSGGSGAGVGGRVVNVNGSLLKELSAVPPADGVRPHGRRKKCRDRQIIVDVSEAGVPGGEGENLFGRGRLRGRLDQPSGDRIDCGTVLRDVLCIQHCSVIVAERNGVGRDELVVRDRQTRERCDQRIILDLRDGGHIHGAGQNELVDVGATRVDPGQASQPQKKRSFLQGPVDAGDPASRKVGRLFADRLRIDRRAVLHPDARQIGAAHGERGDVLQVPGN